MILRRLWWWYCIFFLRMTVPEDLFFVSRPSERYASRVATGLGICLCMSQGYLLGRQLFGTLLE